MRAALSDAALKAMARALRAQLIAIPSGIPISLSDDFSERLARAAWEASPAKTLIEALKFYRDAWTAPPIGREDHQPAYRLYLDQGDRAGLALSSLGGSE